jgi:hypothetical protein
MTAQELFPLLWACELTEAERKIVRSFKVMVDADTKLRREQRDKLDSMARKYGIAPDAASGTRVSPTAIAGFEAGPKAVRPPPSTPWWVKREDNVGGLA